MAIKPIKTEARPLTLGKDQDPVAYARFRLDQIGKHIDFHKVGQADAIMKEFRAETYLLLHTLHTHTDMTIEEEARHLRKVLP
jgi:hypothetical protein